MAAALHDIASLHAAFEVLEDGPDVTAMLAALCREVPVAGRQVHDANIAATMLAHDERRLLTFNTRFPALRRANRAGGDGGGRMSVKAGDSQAVAPPPHRSRQNS